LNVLFCQVRHARCKSEIKYRIIMAKAAFSKKNAFHQLIGLTFKEEKKWYIFSLPLLGRFGQDVRNTLKNVKCAGGEGRRR